MAAEFLLCFAFPVLNVIIDTDFSYTCLARIYLKKNYDLFDLFNFLLYKHNFYAYGFLVI